MNPMLKMLADVDPADVVSAEGQYFSSPRALENLITIGSITVAIIIGTIFALLYRKKRKRKRYHHHRHQQQHSSNPAKESASNSEGSQKRKRRRRRRDRSDLPMNPTLSEAGGLPPPRDENRHWP